MKLTSRILRSVRPGTELWPGAYEEIAPEAFNRSLGVEQADVMALDNRFESSLREFEKRNA